MTVNINKIALSTFIIAMVFQATESTAVAGEITLEGEVALMSDRVFRGISRTNGNISGTGILDIVHENGLYGGVFISNFEDSFGHDFETEFYLGYGTTRGAYDFNLTLSYDTFHGNSDSTGYYEVRGSIARDFGLAYLTGGFAASPDNREFGGGRSYYIYSAAEFPVPLPSLPPMFFDLKVGYEDFEGGFNKWDWAIGFYVDYVGLEWGVQYKDTNLKNFPEAGAKALFTVRKYF